RNTALPNKPTPKLASVPIFLEFPDARRDGSGPADFRERAVTARTATVARRARRAKGSGGPGDRGFGVAQRTTPRRARSHAGQRLDSAGHRIDPSPHDGRAAPTTAGEFPLQRPEVGVVGDHFGERPIEVSAVAP